jgi:BlaI family penicillinase repressor
MKLKNNISEAEAEVLAVLWGSDEPLATADICRTVTAKTGWDRSTVRTLLRRLVEKGAVEEMKLDVLSYRPVLVEEEYRRTETSSFLDRHYGGSVKRLVASLVRNDNLTEDDVAELREFLKTGGDTRE